MIGSFKVTTEVRSYDEARTVSGALSELIEPAPSAFSLFESPQGWRIDVYYADAPEVVELSQQLAAVLPFAPPDLELELVPNENWVAISQAALPPVVAGRFTIHGSHDRGKVPRGPNTLEIEAGEAFGTAHHATTKGCLEALDRLSRRRAFRRVLDVGCGSGVLAIAAARALRGASIKATDYDPIAVKVASDNARLNGVARRIRFQVTNGVPNQGRIAHYDLVLANILAEPLILLAPAMAEAIVPGGVVVLSGLLNRQAAQVCAAYRACNFALMRHQQLTGWSTLTLVKRSSVARSPSRRSRLSG